MEQDFLRKQCIGFLNTPPLWQNEQFGIQQFDFPKVDLNTFKAKPIPQNIRLGHQMEYVFKQLVEHCSAYEILLHNLPIRKGKQTLGEIDFILKESNTGQLIHVELTYKFYIINPEISEPIHRLMGPNRRDMFFTKMEKIKNEQFPLVHSEEGTKALSINDIYASEITHQACYKAQLFTPFNAENSSFRPLNKQCIYGYWLSFDAFNTKDFASFHFYIPRKSEWVVQPHDKVLWQNHFETLMEINLRMLKENAPMIWIKKSDSFIEKCFVVWW